MTNLGSYLVNSSMELKANVKDNDSILIGIWCRGGCKFGWILYGIWEMAAKSTKSGETSIGIQCSITSIYRWLHLRGMFSVDYFIWSILVEIVLNLHNVVGLLSSDLLLGSMMLDCFCIFFWGGLRHQFIVFVLLDAFLRKSIHLFTFHWLFLQATRHIRLFLLSGANMSIPFLCLFLRM